VPLAVAALSVSASRPAPRPLIVKEISAL
jgi:hypothetical protein